MVGPKQVIEAVASTGSFLDGGGSKPLQRAALPLLEPALVLQETAAIQKAFRRKRKLMMKGLRAAGIKLDVAPEATFYCWGDLSALPEPLNDGMQFLKAALDEKVICVPGEFFDVNPGKRRGRTAVTLPAVRPVLVRPRGGHVRTGIERIGRLTRA